MGERRWTGDNSICIEWINLTKGGRTMKKIISIALVFMLTISFLVVGKTRADAMNNESAALLTAGIVLLGIPVMQAIARETTYPERVYAPAYPVQYRHAYPPPRYIERTKIIYVQPKYKGHHRHRGRAYERGYRHEMRHLEYRSGRHDARHDYRRYRDYDD
jgi:hypothetical protein